VYFLAAFFSPCTVLILRKHSLETETLAGSRPPLKPSLSATFITPGQDTQAAGKYDELARALSAAWPSQRDLDLILSVPVGISGFFHGILCTPYSSFPCQDSPSPRKILQLPPPGSHPVLIARKLLILGSFLQGIPSCSTQGLAGLSINYLDIMSHVVETAISLVTIKDELVGSIEGIECIMIESMYQNNAGNLRRAWLAKRRAMVIAQMMGLHRGVSSPSLKILELETRTRVSPEHMWFRLVQSDRYLSLLLGLPQGSLENRFATPKALEGCTPIERMERLDCVAAGRILQRNGADIHDLAATQEVDKLLQEASASMPAQWWLTPDFASSASDNMEAFREIIRIMDQFTHYNLLAQLHLPYLLRYSADRKYDYSKITTVNASREVLVRFVYFRNFNPGASYCRGIDFIAFIASTALCLAHIDAGRQRQVRAGVGDGDGGGTVFDFLAHQRLSDRGMMERALESMEYMTRTTADVIASKIATIVRHLLAIEADAANGVSYKTSSSSGGSEEDLECGVKVSDGGNVLKICIPYFGTIKIERGGVSKSVLAVSKLPDKVPVTSVPKASDSDPAVSFDRLPLLERQVEHENQPLAAANSPAGYQVGGQSANPDWQAVPSHFDYVAPSQQSTSATKSNEVFNFSVDDVQDAQLFVPGLAAGADDWALQGVDMAFFDSLIRGAATPDSSEGESWTWWMGNDSIL
jgi:hypothetical protein